MLKIKRLFMAAFVAASGFSIGLLGTKIFNHDRAHQIDPIFYSKSTKYADRSMVTTALPSMHEESPILISEPPITTTANTITATTASTVVETEPASPWLIYDGVDLQANDVALTFEIACDGTVISLSPFSVMPWYDGIFDTGEFEANTDSVVAWEHLGYYGFWMHAGLDFFNYPQTAYPLQFYFEEDANGRRPYADEFNETLQKCLINSQVVLETKDGKSINAVKAAVRVPADEIPALSTHVMDLVPYLGEIYPDSGFAELESPAIILYFCGQRLSGEIYDIGELFWAQSRIIIAFEPVG